MDRVPGFVVGMATGAILRYAIEKGYTVITAGVIDEVIMSILPPGAMESMRAIGDQMREAEAMGEDKPIDSLFKDFDERTADKANGNGANGNGANGKANGTATATSRRRRSSRRAPEASAVRGPGRRRGRLGGGARRDPARRPGP
jgi:hypothetical protein